MPLNTETNTARKPTPESVTLETQADAVQDKYTDVDLKGPGLKKAHKSLKRFGNTLGTKLNSTYFAHHALCKLRSKGLKNTTKEDTTIAAQLKVTGAVRLPAQNVDALAQIVENYFAQNPCVNGLGTMKREAQAPLAAPLFQLIKGKVESILSAYYKSHFQVYWITAFRYESGGKRDADSSFGFHIDDNPKQLLKVFIYLNDTNESNGAFRTFDYKTSNQLFEQGFISCSIDLRVAAQKLITPELMKEKLEVLSGPKGTILIFDNNLVHKGTMPTEGYRNVICVEVYPSHEPVNQDSVLKGLIKPFDTDYPKNPFINDITGNHFLK